MKVILIGLMVFSLPVLADTPHCTSETEGGKIVTQCDDGTVTVVGTSGTTTVCKAGTLGVECKSFRT